MDGALPSPSLPFLPQTVLLRMRAITYAHSSTLNPASSGLGGAGMGIGAIRKRDH